jgi:hypothetical protein
VVIAATNSRTVKEAASLANLTRMGTMGGVMPLELQRDFHLVHEVFAAVVFHVVDDDRAELLGSIEVHAELGE